ncbi:MAG: hypothetical protein SWX82_35365 [Cyanobacteriota bacterium]|nr:hypothetical protein [Cyanobacteriota bacterium]
MDEQLQQLLQKIRNCPTGSLQHQQIMGSLLSLTPRFPGIRRDAHANYLEALNNTLFNVRQNLAQFLDRADIDQVSASTLREHYVRWVNGFLKYLDFRKKVKQSHLNVLSTGDDT